MKRIVDKLEWLALVAEHPESTSQAISAAVILVNAYNLKTGQCNPSVTTISRCLGCSTRTVERALKKLETIGVIHRLSTAGKKNSFKLAQPSINTSPTPVKTVTPDKFVTPDKSVVPPPTNLSQTEDTLLIDETENRNEKKSNKRKNYRQLSFGNLPAKISTDAAQGFIEHRKLMKAPLTQRAFDQAMKTAARAHEIGITPDQAIDETVAAGWRGIKLEWLQNRLNGNNGQGKNGNERQKSQSELNSEYADKLFGRNPGSYDDGYLWRDLDGSAENPAADAGQIIDLGARRIRTRQ